MNELVQDESEMVVSANIFTILQKYAKSGIKILGWSKLGRNNQLTWFSLDLPGFQSDFLRVKKMRTQRFFTALHFALCIAECPGNGHSAGCYLSLASAGP